MEKYEILNFGEEYIFHDDWINSDKLIIGFSHIILASLNIF